MSPPTTARRTAPAVAALLLAACAGPGGGRSAAGSTGARDPEAAAGGTARTVAAASAPPEPGRCRARGGLPDPVCTPGDDDPRVRPDNVRRTICRRGYAASVRPPMSVTHAIKVREVRAYGLQGVPFAAVELDHLVPLSLGGASTERNLWPELRSGPQGAEAKDVVEVRLHDEVCSGRLGLRAAQAAIARDWPSAP